MVNCFGIAATAPIFLNYIHGKSSICSSGGKSAIGRVILDGLEYGLELVEIVVHQYTFSMTLLFDDCSWVHLFGFLFARPQNSKTIIRIRFIVSHIARSTRSSFHLRDDSINTPEVFFRSTISAP